MPHNLRNTWYRYALLAILITTVNPHALLSQNCFLPVANAFSNPTTTGFHFDWDDFNDTPLFWELEIVKSNQSPDFIPELSNITQSQYTFNNLEAGFSYLVYVRTICSSLDTSAWNGPYRFNTVIDNDASCDIYLEINDNNCQDLDDYIIQVEESNNLIIGQDVIFESISLIIEHDWPSDLNINIESPTGKSVAIYTSVDLGSSSLGLLDSNDCQNNFTLSDFACNSLSSYNSNEITYLPTEILNEAFDGESTNGEWKLQICDNARGDLGIIKYAQLKFNSNDCFPPTQLAVTGVQADNVTIEWEATELNCNRVRIEYRDIESDPQDIFIDYRSCSDKIYELTDLEANTEYILKMFTECGTDIESEMSCAVVFKTACINALLEEDFNASPICSTVCDIACATGDIWQNDELNDNGNWYINHDKTPSSFTGPQADYPTGRGNYIYVESSLNCVSSERFIYLNSSCLDIDESVDCDISFDYHAYGHEDAVISLQRNINDFGWQQIWQSRASSNSNWQSVSVDIINTSDFVRLRFVARFPDGEDRADIALDNIRLYGTDSVSLSQYFLDNDEDGFGGPHTFIFACSNTPPEGYSANSQDCDDNNENINPSATEIPCNRLDDNCNGNSDELGSNVIEYQIVEILNTSCADASDGAIHIEVNSSLNISSIIWSNSMSGEEITGLESGFYNVSISATNGCQLVSDEIEIISDNPFDLEIQNINEPSCVGALDGSLSVNVTGGTEPYMFNWSNGDSGSILTGLRDGIYSVTISDANNCIFVPQEIEISAPQNLTASIISMSNISCNGEEDGRIRVAALGGTGNYTYSWNNSLVGQEINNLSEGIYSVTISDEQTCEIVLEDISIEEPDPLQADILSIENVRCFGASTGAILLDIRGGTPPYSYLWSNGSSQATLSNVPASSYSVTVSDSNNCSSILTNLQIIQNSPVTVLLDSLTNLRCPGSTGGYLSVRAEGGGGIYNYNWSLETDSSDNLHFLDSLTEGRYSITVTDQFNCKSELRSYDVINQNVPLNISLILLDSLECYGDNSAAIIAVNNNGTFPLDFNWSSGRQVSRTMFSDTLQLLPSGDYNVTLTDSEGCIGVSNTIAVNEPQEITLQLNELQNNRCFGDSEGLINISVSGGTEPYQIEWNNNLNGEIIDNLESGTFQATVTDDNNCMLESPSFVVTSPPQISIEATVVNSSGLNNGSITVQPFGGTAPYNYFWAGSLDGIYEMQNASNLSPGQYDLVIIDDNGCSIDTSFVVDLISSNSIVSTEENLKLYPNPSNRELFIEYPDLRGQISLSIIAQDGQTIWSAREKLSTIPLNNILNDAGLYMLEVQSENVRLVERFIFLK